MQVNIVSIFIEKFWWLLPVIIAVSILKIPWFKGLFGEWLVKVSANYLLDKSIYHAVHNATLETPDGTIVVDHGISGLYVTRVLERAAIFRGFPQAIRTDGGPEFTSRVFMGWMHTNGIEHLLIQPGKPTQNAYIESFNGKFRDECLNEQWFETLAQARKVISAWRRDYNEVRPHSSCGRIPPAIYAQKLRQIK